MKAVAVLLALIVPPLVYFPTLGKRHEEQQQRADAQLHDVEVRVEEAHAAGQKMQQFLEEQGRLAADVQAYRVTLPPKPSASDILRTLEAAATSKGVRLIRFAPRTPTDSPPLQVVSIEVEAEGGPVLIDALLKDIGGPPQPGKRFLTVSGVTPAGVRTSFVVTGYALPDPK